MIPDVTKVLAVPNGVRGDGSIRWTKHRSAPLAGIAPSNLRMLMVTKVVTVAEKHGTVQLELVNLSPL